MLVTLRKAWAGWVVLIMIQGAPAAQAAALALASTAYVAVVAWYRPFAPLKGTFLGKQVDVLNASEITASAVVALNQWSSLLTGSKASSFSNGWGLSLAIINYAVLALLLQRMVQLAIQIPEALHPLMSLYGTTMS